ncbi:Alkaline ceramidase [Seminavis robusta]|uniref:Alkaline ceramidase n=1 Tax=Seminavis robusta TaxID=568900 RepID=A0A9N8DE29_9STRA|nr:Alkaline ceramidase [Seminavis robusta]|eukprot:Sro75_g041420.1 Alkaline ceramidase (258) ;mRNA; r:108091-108864
MAENVTLADYFRRGTTNIQWCEDLVAKHAHSDWVAEYYNTWSNLPFYMVAIFGMKRCVEMKLNRSFWAAEVVMFLGIGIGSTLFHAHQSRVAQYADEIPMTLLLIAQINGMEGTHPWLTSSIKGKQAPFYRWLHGFVACIWALYVYTNDYAFFTVVFSVQICTNFGMLGDCGRRLKHSQLNWYIAMTFIAVAKICWELERKLYRDGACDTPGALSLHPVWHLGAGIAHYFGMRQCAELLEFSNRGKLGNSKKIDKVD